MVRLKKERAIEFSHNDVIKWKHFQRYWPFVRGIHRHRWIPRTKASDAELWCFLWSAPWINGWVNIREAADLSRHCAYHDVIVVAMFPFATMGHAWTVSIPRDQWLGIESVWAFVFMRTKLLELKYYALHSWYLASFLTPLANWHQ